MSTFPTPHEETLDNGLRVQIEPRRGHGRGLAAVALTVAAGSDQDPAGRHGTAHLVEHLMFPRSGGEGTGGEDGAADGHAAQVAAVGGACNAETHRDRTVFHTVAPAALLDTVLAMEAGRLREFAPAPAVLRTETEVITEEIRGSAGGGLLWNTVLAALAPGSRDSYGSPRELAATGVADVSDFFRRHYRPGAMALTVVGEVDPVPVLRRVRKLFGGIGSAAGPTASAGGRSADTAGSRASGGSPVPVPGISGSGGPVSGTALHRGPGRGTLPGSRTVTAALPWAGEAVAVGHLLPSPARRLPSHLAQVVLAEVLSRSRLPTLVRSDPRLTSARVTCGLYGQWLGAHAPEPVLAVLGRAPGTGAEEAADAWAAALREVARRPPGTPELRRAVNALLLAWHRGADSLTARAVTHGHHALFLPGGGGAAGLPGALARVTAEEVSAAAGALLTGPHSVTALTGPTDPAVPTAPTEPAEPTAPGG